MSVSAALQKVRKQRRKEGWPNCQGWLAGSPGFDGGGLIGHAPTPCQHTRVIDEIVRQVKKTKSPDLCEKMVATTRKRLQKGLSSQSRVHASHHHHDLDSDFVATMA